MSVEVLYRDLCPFSINMPVFVTSHSSLVFLAVASVGAQQTRDKAFIHASLVVRRSRPPCVAEWHYHSF